MENKFKYLRELELTNPYLSYSPQQIKKQYFSLAKKYHPDYGGSEEEFRRIYHAYKMLTDPHYQYERDDTPVNLNVMLNIAITFEQAFFGDNLTIATNPIILNDNKEQDPSGKDLFLDIEVMKISVPQGTLDGDTVCVKNKGLTYRNKRGDVIVTLRVKRHPFFTMKGPHVVSLESVPLDIMLRGGSIDVSTMYGLKKLDIPQGARPNTEIQMKNLGVGEVGSHIAIIQPIYPSKEDLRSKKEWKSFFKT